MKLQAASSIHLKKSSNPLKQRNSFSNDTNIPTNLLGDKTKFTQIMLNLIGNALKITKEGRIHVNLKLKEKNEKRSQGYS